MQTAISRGDQHTVELPTGTLTLRRKSGSKVEDLCDFAARANPKRGFLIVSKVLGRHVPARPADMRRIMADLAVSLPDDLAGPVVFLGMAETATALGQGIFAAYQQINPGTISVYLQTSRQVVDGAQVLARFEEGHSHATSHMVQLADPAIAGVVNNAQTLVIVDDECSTGNTFVAAARAMAEHMPLLERIETCCITDWSGQAYLQQMPRPAASHSLLAGELSWTPSAVSVAPVLSSRTNAQGLAPAQGMRSRGGLHHPEAARREPVFAAPGSRVLVLGDGEHSYEALLIAEAVEAQGAIAAVQSITRTPALPGPAMKSCSTFEDAYGSGAPTFCYNIGGHQPDLIIIAAEVVDNQVADAEAACAKLGFAARIQLVHCTYPVSA